LGLDELSGKRRICAIGRYRIIDRNQCRLRPLASLIVDMNTPNRAILIGGVVAAAVIVGVVTLLLYEKQDYRDCVAQMWDRKHPEAVKARKREADLRDCETNRLRNGVTCDCNAASGQPGYCPPPTNYGPSGEVADATPCEHLSLEELRRADADASRDKPPR